MKKILMLSVLLGMTSIYAMDGGVDPINLAPEGGDIYQPVDRGGPGDQGGEDRNNDDQGGRDDRGNVLTREGGGANQGSGGAKTGGAGVDGDGTGVQVINGPGDGGSVNTTDMSQQITRSQAVLIENAIHSGQEAPTQNALPELSSNGQEVVTALTEGIRTPLKKAKSIAIDNAITALERFEQFHDSTSPERALLDVLKRVKSFLEVSADEKQSMLDGLNRDIDVATKQHLGLADVLKKIKNFVNKEIKKKISIEDEEGDDGFKTPNISESDDQNILKNSEALRSWLKQEESNVEFSDEALKTIFVELGLTDSIPDSQEGMEELYKTKNNEFNSLQIDLLSAEKLLKRNYDDGNLLIRKRDRNERNDSDVLLSDSESGVWKKIKLFDTEQQQTAMKKFIAKELISLMRLEKAVEILDVEEKLIEIEASNQLALKQTTALVDTLNTLKTVNSLDMFEILEKRTRGYSAKLDLEHQMLNQKMMELEKFLSNAKSDKEKQAVQRVIDNQKAIAVEVQNALAEISKFTQGGEAISELREIGRLRMNVSMVDALNLNSDFPFLKDQLKEAQAKAWEKLEKYNPQDVAKNFNFTGIKPEKLINLLNMEIPGEDSWSSTFNVQFHLKVLEQLLNTDFGALAPNNPKVRTQFAADFKSFQDFQTTANQMLKNPSSFSRSDVESLQDSMNELLRTMKGRTQSFFRTVALKDEQLQLMNALHEQMNSLVDQLSDPTIASQFSVIPKPKPWSFSNPVKALWNRYLKWAYGKDSQTVTPIDWENPTTKFLNSAQDFLEKIAENPSDQIQVEQKQFLDNFNSSFLGKLFDDINAKKLAIQKDQPKENVSNLDTILDTIGRVEQQRMLASADVAQFDALTSEKRLALLIQTPESALNFLLCMEKSQPTILKNVKNGYGDFLGKWSNDSTWGDNPIENRTKLQQMVDEFQKSYSQNASITNLRDTFTTMVSSADLMFDESESGKPITDIVEQIDPRKFTDEKLIDFMNHFLIEGKLKNAISFEENQKSVATLAGGNAKSVLESLYFQGGTLVDADGNPITVGNHEFLTVARNFIQNFIGPDFEDKSFSDVVQKQCLNGENLSIFCELAHFQEVQFRAQQIALPSGNEIRTEQKQLELIKQTQIYRDLTSQFLNDQLAFMFVEKYFAEKPMVEFSPLQKQVVSHSIFDMMTNSSSESGQEITELQDQITKLITSKMQTLGIIKEAPAQAPEPGVTKEAPELGIAKETSAEAPAVVEGA